MRLWKLKLKSQNIHYIKNLGRLFLFIMIWLNYNTNSHAYSLNNFFFKLMDFFVQYVTQKLQLTQSRRIIHFIKKLAGFLFKYNDIISLTHIITNWKKEKSRELTFITDNSLCLKLAVFLRSSERVFGYICYSNIIVKAYIYMYRR